MFRHLSFFITSTRAHEERMRLINRQIVHCPTLPNNLQSFNSATFV